jgi:hypothetical protein
MNIADLHGWRTWGYRPGMKPGDLIWQTRQPGGECLLVKIFFTRDSYDRGMIWIDNDWPVLRVLSAEEGLIDDPHYYYEQLPGAEMREILQGKEHEARG